MDNFLTTHRLDPARDTPSPFSSQAGIPDDLAALLLKVHSNTYANGFFQFGSDNNLRRYFSLWGIDPKECFPFIRCGFGHLVFYYRESYKLLNPVYNCIDNLGQKDELDFVMDVMLCDRPGLESSFLIDIYEQAFPRLKSPGNDEIYAFVPALGLGGSRNAATVQRLKMDAQMSILANI